MVRGWFNRRKLAVLIPLLGIIGGAAQVAAFGQRRQDRGSLPPIGDRKYVIDLHDPSEPVTIKGAEAKIQGQKYLKDPVQPSPEARVEVAHPAPVPRKRGKVLASRPGLLRFKKLPVAGHLLQPRVEFSRDVLPVDRADESTRQDFFPKVFAPAADQSF
jgi:hypothetical protein